VLQRAVFVIYTPIHYSSANLTHRAAIFNKNFWPREETRLINVSEKRFTLSTIGSHPSEMTPVTFISAPRTGSMRIGPPVSVYFPKKIARSAPIKKHKMNMTIEV
jgi:hypothetical protein